jgi:NAD(P)-dependent dehydrogenase (short-subunit alcohol dehydrogenase family)
MRQPTDRAPVPISQERLDGRVGIITGGGRGSGAATALELAGLGARLVITDRSLETCANAVARVRGTGAQAMWASWVTVDLPRHDGPHDYRS